MFEEMTYETIMRSMMEDMPDDISWIGGEHLIMREEGSGTRKEAGKQLDLDWLRLSL